MSVLGIDVSKYQAEIDWDAVASDSDAALKFAIIRTSYGDDASKEHLFGANWLGARGAGLICGSYHYFLPRDSVTDVDRQSALFLDTFNANVPVAEIGFLPPVLDIEEALGDVDAATYVAGIRRWIDAVESSVRFKFQKVMIYTTASQWKRLGNPIGFESRLLWVADYSEDPPRLPAGWSEFTFFQYSSTGSVKGIDGNVDLDRFDGDMVQLNALTFKGNPPVQASTFSRHSHHADSTAATTGTRAVVETDQPAEPRSSARVLARWRLATPDDTYLDRVAKYVPVEVVGAYLAINRLYPVDDKQEWNSIAIVFALCWLAVPLYVWRLKQGTPSKPWKVQAAVSTIAFPVWAFAIGGLMFANWTNDKLPSVCLILFSLFAGLIEPVKQDPEQTRTR
jgi:GH25 family lysozyme M1 (1,4-beta-N-acetylmuramidase)